MRSLAVKLTLAFLLVGLTGAVLVAVILQVRTRTAFNQFILNRDQQTLVDSLQNYYVQNKSWQGVVDVYGSNNTDAMMPNNRQGFGFNRPGSYHFTLVDVDHIILISDPPNRMGQYAPDSELNHAVILKANNQNIGWLVFNFFPDQFGPTSPEGIFLGTVTNATRLSALVAVLLALLLGTFLAFTMTRSLREMTDATNQIAKGNFGYQVKVRSKDELGKLATSFNAMSNEIKHATDLRNQMTADIAHDLRTPLSVISGYAEALSDQKLPGTPEVYGILYQETQHLSRLVEDLRTLSLADAGELTMTFQPTDPKAFLERVVVRHQLTAQQKSISLQADVDEGLPTVIMDPERMSQVFDNLVSNAFRYTPQGGAVTLSAHSSEDKLVFLVLDNGSGISEKDIDHVFDRFYRGDQNRQQTGESGLGLAIAKSIIEAHHGTLTVTSTVGQGTEFTISIPIDEADSPQSA
jgi:two-component system, OmpR family, sensor histidine kinase BaeS